jgi:hypothetical protein
MSVQRKTIAFYDEDFGPEDDDRVASSGFGDLLKTVEKTVEEELTRATVVHGHRFHSEAEGYAVIREEYEEAAEELIKFEDIEHNQLWKAIRNNKPTKKHAEDLLQIAMNAAAESIQTAAMLKKYLRGFDK